MGNIYKKQCQGIKAMFEKMKILEKTNKKMTYEDNIEFFRIIIPNLDYKLKKQIKKDDSVSTKSKILESIVSEYIDKYLYYCQEYLEEYGI